MGANLIRDTSLQQQIAILPCNRLRKRFLVVRNIALLCLLLAPVVSVDASEDVFAQLIEMRQAADLFHKKRYKDSVEAFDLIYQDLHAEDERDLNRLSTVLNFLAQGRSFLGQHAATLELMNERLSIAKEMFGEKSEEYSSILAAVAEAHFRNGDTETAKSVITLAIQGLEKNAQEDSDYLGLARINLEKYSNGNFDEASLPVDLSEFYSRCESIIPGESEDSVSLKMSSFLELGVDYQPQDFWAAMFEIAAMGPDGTAREGNNYRRIFIPGDAETVRADVCVVDQHSGIVVSAENSLE